MDTRHREMEKMLEEKKASARAVRAEANAKGIELPDLPLTEVEVIGLKLMNRSKRRAWLKANEKRLKAIRPAS